MTILLHSLQTLRHLRHVLRHTLMHHGSMSHVRRCVVGWQRAVGALSSHVIPHTIPILLLRRSEGIVLEVRRAVVWRTVVRRSVM